MCKLKLLKLLPVNFGTIQSFYTNSSFIHIYSSIRKYIFFTGRYNDKEIDLLVNYAQDSIS